MTPTRDVEEPTMHTIFVFEGTDWRPVGSYRSRLLVDLIVMSYRRDGFDACFLAW